MPYSPMQLAEAFLKTGELDDALQAIEQQLADHPDDDTARRLLIQIQMRLLPSGTTDTILAQYDALSEQTIEDYQIKSTVLERASRHDDAIQAIRSARELAPHDERLTERLLDLLLATEAYDDALELTREQDKTWRWLEREGDVLALLGNDILAVARYGLVLAQLSEFEDTMREEYLQALKLRVIQARGNAYRRLGEIHIAREHYSAAKAVIGDDATIDFNLGLLDWMDDNLDNAITLCQSALDTASSGLKAEMLSALDDDPQFATLKQQLTI